MITEAVLYVFTALFSFVLNLLPSMSLPSWLTSSASTIGGAMNNLNVFSNVIPVQAVGNAATFLLTVTVVIFAVRFFRMVLSLLTGGGGNVA